MALRPAAFASDAGPWQVALVKAGPTFSVSGKGDSTGMLVPLAPLPASTSSAPFEPGVLGLPLWAPSFVLQRPVGVISRGSEGGAVTTWMLMALPRRLWIRQRPSHHAFSRSFSHGQALGSLAAPPHTPCPFRPGGEDSPRVLIPGLSLTLADIPQLFCDTPTCAPCVWGPPCGDVPLTSTELSLKLAAVVILPGKGHHRPRCSLLCLD